MIEAKGTKATATEADASQRYALKSMDRKSKTPLVFGVFLTGLALYLKSIFPSWASEERPVPAEAENEGVAQPEMAPAQKLLPFDPMTVGTTPSAPAAFGSGHPLVDLQPPARFRLMDTPQIGDFLPPESPIAWELTDPVPFAHPANDNVDGGNMAAPIAPDEVDPVDADPTGPDRDDVVPDGDGDCPLACSDDADSGSCNEDTDTASCSESTDAGSCSGDSAKDRCDDGDNGAGADSSGKDDTPCEASNNGAKRTQGSCSPSYLSDIGSGATLAIGLSHSLRYEADSATKTTSSNSPPACSGAPTRPTDDGDPPERREIEVAAVQAAHAPVIETAAQGTGADRLPGIMCAAESDEGNADDTLGARSGDDIITASGGEPYGAQGGHEPVLVGDGRDPACGGKPNVTVLDNAGDDHVVAALNRSDDVYEGGEGFDTLDYSEATDDLTIDLMAGRATGLEIGTDHISGFEKIIGGQGDDHFIAGREAVVFVGGGGNNIYDFSHVQMAALEAADDYGILDFKVGDRIRISSYDLFEKSCDAPEDRFEKIYGDDIEDDDVPIRYRHDRTDEMSKTFIEADFNNDGIYETAIWLDGHRLLVAIEHV